MTVQQALARPVFIKLHGFTEKDASVYLTTSASEHVQVGAGTLGGEIGFMPLLHASMRRVKFTLDMRFSATLQANCINLIFAMQVAEGTRVSGRAVRVGDVIAMNEGTYSDSRLNAGTTWMGMRLPRGEIIRQWNAVTDRDLFWQHGLVAVTPTGMQSDALASTLQSVETIARTRPELFDQPLWRRNVERCIVSRFISSLQSGMDTDRGGFHRRSTQEIVRSADEFLESLADPACSVPELCAALGVGQRSLQRAFRETLDLRPKQYLQLRSLTAVRRDLMDPAKLDETVTSIAMHHGFWHLGRFSSFYGAHFGELPRVTRRRTTQRAFPGARPV